VSRGTAGHATKLRSSDRLRSPLIGHYRVRYWTLDSPPVPEGIYAFLMNITALALILSCCSERHFVDEMLGTIDLVHDPEHVTGIDVNRARGACVEVPVRVNALDRAIE
jgi:hypothetical protein